MLSRFWTGQRQRIGPAMANCIRRTKCGQLQPETVNHVVESCSLTKLADDGLFSAQLLLFRRSLPECHSP